MEGIYHFNLELNDNFHNELIGFLYYLGFPEDETIKVDTPFSELDGGYIYVHHNQFKIHLCVRQDSVDIVFDTSLSQKELYKLMKKYFIFPIK